MKLIRPKRKIIYGIPLLLIWMTVSATICLVTSVDDVEVPPGLNSHSTSTYRIGLVEWLWIKETNSANVPGITHSYSYEYFIMGGLANLALCIIVGVLFFKLWQRMYMNGHALKDICDACGYSLQGQVSLRCPECGESNSESTKSNSSVIIEFLFLLWLLIGFTLGYLASAGLQLSILMKMDFEIITNSIMVILVLKIMCVSLIGLLIFWQYTGSGFEKEGDSPRKHYFYSITSAWLPLGAVLLFIILTFSLHLWKPYRDDGFHQYVLLLKLIPIGFLFGVILQFLSLYRIRNAARLAGLCFNCGTSHNDSKFHLCQDCRPIELDAN